MGSPLPYENHPLIFAKAGLDILEVGYQNLFKPDFDLQGRLTSNTVEWLNLPHTNSY